MESGDAGLCGDGPERLRWSKEKLDSVKGVPWQPKGELYITLDRQIKYGQTPGCPGCFSTLDDPKRHSAECKKRFDEDQLAKEKQEPLVQADVQEIPDVEAGNSAPSSGSAGSTAGQAGSPAGQLDPAGSAADSSGVKRAASSRNLGAKEGEKDIEARRKESGRTPARRPGSTPGTRGRSGRWSSDTALDTVYSIAAYPEWGKVTAAYDERTGVQLPLAKVKKARGRELDKMEEHQVKTDITWEEARQKGPQGREG